MDIERRHEYEEMGGCILILDGERKSAELAEKCLCQAGYDVDKCVDVEQALQRLMQQKFDLVILDLAQLGLAGGRFCRRLREQFSCQVLLLIAPGDIATQYDGGIAWGAAGFVAKPFRPHELIQQVAALLASASLPSGIAQCFSICGLTIDRKQHICLLDGRQIALTPLEFEILRLLATNRGRVVSAEELFCRIWREPYLNGGNTVMVHIRHLREKLGETPQPPRFIKTVRGIGYIMEVMDQPA